MNLHSAVFYTNDIEKVIPFYRDTLGFEVEYIQDSKFVSFIFPNGARLGIKQKKEDREIPGAQTVFISVENIKETYNKLKSNPNITFLKELVDDATWAPNFSITDPDKNKVQFVKEK
ncbi:MAG: glyoxalase superfamily protein [Patescibacteria group bacterium]|nr:glyoxalase superfamily protein [Patescibacteria group bacterium]